MTQHEDRPAFTRVYFPDTEPLDMDDATFARWRSLDLVYQTDEGSWWVRPITPTCEYDMPERPWADAWFWTVGDGWSAVVAEHERDTWWGVGVDDSPPDKPERWEYPIHELPPSGTLHWRDWAGHDHMRVIGDPLTLPMPWEYFEGRIVIASTWTADDHTNPPRLATVLLLNPIAPYYTVAQLVAPDNAWRMGEHEDFRNINRAVEDGYQQWGGDD